MKLTVEDWRHLLRDRSLLADEEGMLVSRPKSKFPTARKAWADVAKATGKTPADVIKKDHTATHWRWRLRK